MALTSFSTSASSELLPYATRSRSEALDWEAPRGRVESCESALNFFVGGLDGPAVLVDTGWEEKRGGSGSA